MARLGLDISQVVYEGTGVARFTEGLTRAILEYDRDNEWTFFCIGARRNPSEALLSAIESHPRHRYRRMFLPQSLGVLLAYHIRPLASLLTRHIEKNLDFFISSDWIEPPMSIPSGTIVHDLVFRRFPDTVHPTIKTVQEQRLSHVTANTQVIFADSVATRDDLLTYYPHMRSEIVVNYPGVYPLPRATDPSLVRERYGIKKPFILSVGKQEPRKNIDRLLQAFAGYKTHHQSDETELVIVGSHGWGAASEKSRSADVRYLGFVPDEDLNALYGRALGFVMPSLYEGFGYPVIEAMHAGCPVAVSKTSSLAEIISADAILFHPDHTHELTRAISRLITEHEKLKRAAMDAGIAHAQTFSWERYYDAMIRSIHPHLQ